MYDQVLNRCVIALESFERDCDDLYGYQIVAEMAGMEADASVATPAGKKVPIWTRIKNLATTIYTKYIKPVIDFIVRQIGNIGSFIGGIPATIKGIPSKIRAMTKRGKEMDQAATELGNITAEAEKVENADGEGAENLLQKIKAWFAKWFSKKDDGSETASAAESFMIAAMEAEEGGTPEGEPKEEVKVNFFKQLIDNLSKKSKTFGTKVGNIFQKVMGRIKKKETQPAEGSEDTEQAKKISMLAKALGQIEKGWSHVTKFAGNCASTISGWAKNSKDAVVNKVNDVKAKHAAKKAEKNTPPANEAPATDSFIETFLGIYG